MSTNRPAPTARINWESVTIAIAAVAALTITTVLIALAAFAVGAYPHRGSEEPTTAPASQAETPEAPARAAGHETAEPSRDLLDPSVGRGADSKVCAASPRSPRCRLEGGGGLSRTRGGHALRPAADSPQTVLLHSEWDETGPADMPGRAPGRGGWVGEEGPSRA